MPVKEINAKYYMIPMPELFEKFGIEAKEKNYNAWLDETKSTLVIELQEKPA